MIRDVTYTFASKRFGGRILPVKQRNDQEVPLRKLAFLATVFSILFMASSFASAQQGDAYFGFGTITSPGASSCGFTASSSTGYACPETGGLYPNLGADVIFHKRFGVGFDVAWRGTQGAYNGQDDGQPFRPILFDFNGVYQPRISKKVGLDLAAGVGFQSTRFYSYSETTGCVYFGACYNSSDHFLVDVGGGIRYYVWGHFFIRPEAHYYWINNNTADFTGNNVFRMGASIGYTIGGPDNN
jgi:hypothetical protein